MDPLDNPSGRRVPDGHAVAPPEPRTLNPAPPPSQRFDASTPQRLALRRARLLACREVRGDCSEWEVEVDGRTETAVAFASLAGPLRPGDEALLNTTAAALGLGTGGAHFVIARTEPGEQPGPPFAGREAGHILKLRYTPLQHRVRAAEEEGSPHREAVIGFPGLAGIPVLAAELHSQAAAAALAAHAARPDRRIAWVQLDSAALPASFSRLVHRLRADGIIAGTVSTGQGFGGDFEAVNVYTGLIVAASVVKADLIVVTQGPGNVGTGTEYGFSGLALVEALHAAEHLGGCPILAVRMSEGDDRARHRGVSHHTRTLLHCLRVEAALPVPSTAPVDGLPAGCDIRRVDPEPAMTALRTYEDLLTTMGRRLEADPLFFQAAAAAGIYAARTVR